VNCQQPQDVAADRLLSPLRYPRLIHDDYDSPLNFAARYDARFDAMRASGAWVQAHPWFEALLPLDALEGFVHQALALLPPFFGGGHRILFHPQLDRPKALAFPREPAAGFAILPEGIPEPVVPKSLEVLRQLDDLVQQLGGKRYLSGFLFDMGRAGWQRHYQGNYEGLRRAKHEFDPDDVFGSRLAPLA
jgi:cytokinin dehydrogenase